MQASSDFQGFQHAFAAYLRAPRRRPPPGVPASAAARYAELAGNKLCSFIDPCFPVSRALLGEARWRRLCRRFQRMQVLQSPWFRDIPRAFVDFVAGQAAHSRLPRYLPDLLHYEWVELALDILPVAQPEYDPEGDLLSGIVSLNPALFNLAYAWPVQRIGPDWRPRRPQATQLAVYRDAADVVRFCELNPLAASLLDILAEGGLTGLQALQGLQTRAPGCSPAHFLAHGAATLQALREQGLILGSRR